MYMHRVYIMCSQYAHCIQEQSGGGGPSQAATRSWPVDWARRLGADLLVDWEIYIYPHGALQSHLSGKGHEGAGGSPR